MTDYAQNLAAINARIAAACERSGRSTSEVTLVAVSKGHDLDAIRAVHALGVRDFGESYAQEWKDKAAGLDLDLRWHFIGHLQSNKVRTVADHIALFHSVDRNSLMRELNKRSEQTCDVLLQLNVGEDPNKWGAAPEDALRLVESALSFPRLRLRGLMTIPPQAESAEDSRPVFAGLRAAADKIRARWPEHPRLQNFDQLSMGMTNDFEVAIEEGATHIRVGTALFGPRNYT